VVPLEQLMEDDAVEEATQAQAQQDGAGDGRGEPQLVSCGMFCIAHASGHAGAQSKRRATNRLTVCQRASGLWRLSGADDVASGGLAA
jgi:hypothetical protein